MFGCENGFIAMSVLCPGLKKEGKSRRAFVGKITIEHEQRIPEKWKEIAGRWIHLHHGRNEPKGSH